MATRNLTKKFVEIRNAAKANRSLGVATRDDDEGLLKRTGRESTDWNAVKHSLPPDWTEKIEVVDEDISKIQAKIQELTVLHNKRLLVNFETDETQQEREIEAKTADITKIFHHAEDQLKQFKNLTDRSSATAAEKQVRVNMQMSMAKKLQSLSMSFRSTQKQYMNRLQGQKNGSGAQAFDFLSEGEKKAAASEFVDSGFTSAQVTALEDIESMVNERDEEIAKIAKSIQELAQIFKELAVLVIDQGTILDRIDYNMENAVEHAKEGIVHLEKAEEHQKNALSVKCIILLVVLIAIMLGILIWKHQK